jgi:hypothetical protein
MESSDVGKPPVVSEPESVQAHAFTKTAKVIAGRISIIASEIKAQEQGQNQTTEQAKKD